MHCWGGSASRKGARKRVVVASDDHFYNGMRKILLLSTLSLLTYLGTVAARLRAGDEDRMRQMTVKVA